MKYLFFVSVIILSMFSSEISFAAEGSLDWSNFTYRIVNLLLVLAILYYAFGKKVRDFFSERRATLIRSFDELKKRKEDALVELSRIESSIESFKEEQEILAAKEYEKTQALCATILEDANKAAKQIIAQAEKMAQYEVLEFKRKLLEEVSEQIIADVTKHISQSFSKEDSLLFLKKSVGKAMQDAK